VRAFDPVPGAWTTLHDTPVKLFRPAAEDAPASAQPGTVLRVTPADPTRGILVACGGGALWMRDVQPAGKRPMSAADWVRGRGVEAGARFV
jgi:methionyl-tRNA formyltransferase